ncbi:ATP-binding protein [Candidatus Saganbacteria bacterium]|nr:ATP-binding protein [Candidatus Saganbacteria bacterium]
MKRNIEKELIKWKNQAERYPLIIMGARQVGKSYLIEQFGKENFKHLVTVNFELQPNLKQCFNELEPGEILNKLKMQLGVPIDEENTLLFFDEIQECPQAIMSLRYFKEKMPKLAVISAGSLLEFALNSKDFKMPVGRIHFLYLDPLSFGEFLEALGNSQLCQYTANLNVTDHTDEIAHDKLLELVRRYMLLGGMPAVLREYFSNKDMAECQNIQSSLIQTYRSDFGKYSNRAQHKHLLKVMDMAPRLAGKKIKYSEIDAESKSRELKNAIELLALSGIIKPIYRTKASGLPLGAEITEKIFRLNFLDVGLMQNICGISAQLAIEQDIMQINSGAIAEQFVGQELTAYGDKHKPSQLFFWIRDKKGSMAEIDYVIDVDAKILPVEVKSGKAGKLKSLRLFMKEKGLRFGIRISQEKLSYYDGILSIPLYLIEHLPRLARSIMLTKGI